MAKFWTKGELRDMRRLYPHHPSSEIAKWMGRSISSIRNQAHILGLRKTVETKRALVAKAFVERGAAHRFRPGLRPWNAGLKGWQAGGRAEDTKFRKGNRPKTWVPVGTIITDPDGYRHIKTKEPNHWKLLHRYRWEKRRGRIPSGKALIFRNGDKTDCRLSNLKLVSRAELMKRNTVHRLPEPLKGAIRAIAALNRRINAQDSK